MKWPLMTRRKHLRILRSFERAVKAGEGTADTLRILFLEASKNACELQEEVEKLREENRHLADALHLTGEEQ